MHVHFTMHIARIGHYITIAVQLILQLGGGYNDLGIDGIACPDYALSTLHRMSTLDMSENKDELILILFSWCKIQQHENKVILFLEPILANIKSEIVQRFLNKHSVARFCMLQGWRIQDGW